ncbi:uncharacterized protein LOC105446995 [Strongylocentrotus purpuratus]|uniref:Ig-like domain-containing protein n=1 Tax=Strongylocentrotus purpuratus TaxID=7668 RepID=A0A7M7NAF1_STRPU|nr:uncharacterized protein LOC105446995 [Strongylocentrotus purpuratus]
MFIRIYVIIFVFVELTFLAGLIYAMEFEVTPLEIGVTGKIPCDGLGNVDEDVRLVQWYKSRNIDAFENGDPSLASWREGESRILPNYHMDETTFSLAIDMATLEDEGLYRCSVVRGRSLTESEYFTRTVMYALPRIDPKIALDTELNRVHCTVEHVKPLTFPVLNFDGIPDSTETYAVVHEDGTYTISVSCTLPQTKSASRVDCSFSYLNYQGGGSSDLRDITTGSLMEKRTTTVSTLVTSVPFAGNGCRTIHNTAFIDWKIYIGLTLAGFMMRIV